MLPDGSYARKKTPSGKRPVNAQESWIPKRRSADGHEIPEAVTLKHRPDD
jgi:hypothetical protein